MKSSDKLAIYRDWLGLEALDQLPNHYQILGLHPYRVTAEGVNDALSRQLQMLDEIRSDGRSLLQYRRLVNEVIAAAELLSDANQKRDYDRQLQCATLITPITANDLVVQGQAPRQQHSGKVLPPERKTQSPTNCSKVSPPPQRHRARLHYHHGFVLMMVILPFLFVHRFTIRETEQAVDLEHALDLPQDYAATQDATTFTKDTKSEDFVSDTPVTRQARNAEFRFASVCAPRRSSILEEQFVSLPDPLPSPYVEERETERIDVELPRQTYAPIADENGEDETDRWIQPIVKTTPVVPSTEQTLASNQAPYYSPASPNTTRKSLSEESAYVPPLNLDQGLMEQIILGSLPAVIDVDGSMSAEQKRIFVSKLKAITERDRTFGRDDKELEKLYRSLQSMSNDSRLPYALGLLYDSHGKISEALKCYRKSCDARPRIPFFAAWRQAILLRLSTHKIQDVKKAVTQSVEFADRLVSMSKEPNGGEFENTLMYNIHFLGKLYGYLDKASQAGMRWNNLNYAAEENRVLAKLKELRIREKNIRVFEVGKQGLAVKFADAKTQENLVNEERRNSAAERNSKETTVYKTVNRDTQPIVLPYSDLQPFSSPALPPRYETYAGRETKVEVKDTRKSDPRWRRAVPYSRFVRTHFERNLNSSRWLLMESFPEESQP